MSDLISRQDAIDAMYQIVERNRKPVFDDDWAENPHIDVIVDELENLPSAEPERKTGEWIHYEGQFEYDWICSECDSASNFRSDYCPMCGAKMEERE